MIPLSILSFGAVGDGKKDNGDIINNALMVGKAQGQPVFVPCGVFAYSGVLNADSVLLYGEGEGSVLHALDPEHEAIFLRGQGPGVRNLKLAGVVPTERLSAWDCSRVVARAGASHWQVEGVLIETGSASGIAAEEACDGRIVGNRVSDTLADAIHMTDKTHDVLISHNLIERPGDDGIACVSYQGNGGYVERITARHNVIRDQKGGRGMSVVGGRNVRYEFNQIQNNLSSAGVYISQEDSWETYGAHDVLVRRNSLYNCGGIDKDHPSILIFSSGYEKNTNIRIERNLIVIDVENKGGIRAADEDVSVVFDSNAMMGCTPNYRISYPDAVTVIDYSDGPVGIAAQGETQ